MLSHLLPVKLERFSVRSHENRVLSFVLVLHCIVSGSAHPNINE